MKVTEIIEKYISGEITLEETNAQLRELNVGFHLDPEKNEIKPEEEEHFGMLDTGTGTLDKVKVVKDENGIRLERPVFNPESFKGYALPVADVKYADEWYKVADDGITLVKE